MRIVGHKFKDYYDTVQAYGQDSGTIFVRKTEERDVSDDQGLNKIFAQQGHNIGSRYFSDSIYRDSDLRNKESELILMPATVIFTGVAYPVIRVIEKLEKPKVSGSSYSYHVMSHFYEAQELADFLTARGFDMTKEVGWFECRATRFKKLQKFFEPIDISDWAIKNRVVIALAYVCNMRDSKIIINPKLSEIEFWKKMDAYKAYQEISMFISGVLSNTGGEMVEIADTYRIKMHGYDNMSFRKAPTKKIKKRT